MGYTIVTEILGHSMRFVTDASCFAPRHIDGGTRLMLENTELRSGLKVLDLGCGYGVVGCACAKIMQEGQVTMADISEKAVACARENAEKNMAGLTGINWTAVVSDGLTHIPNADFDLILCNPPYHTDYGVAKAFIEDGYRRLAVGGRMVMVVKKSIWYKNKLTSVFGGVKLLEAEGYTLLTSEKRAVRRKEKVKAIPKKHLKKMMRSGEM